MKVLMFGWEFPPLNSGGLGTACYGITKALSKQNVNITFVLPSTLSSLNANYMKLIFANQKDIHSFDFEGFKIRQVDSILTPYHNPQSYLNTLEQTKARLNLLGHENVIYGQSMFSEILRYASAATNIAYEEEFDVIHCHDWMTFPAGINAKIQAKKKGLKAPLVAHIHATESDRTAGNPNSLIYQIEKIGLQAADHIVAVSNYTKNIIVQQYNISPSKISVIHNAVEKDPAPQRKKFNLKEHYKLVLFLGRITIQKGPDYFIQTAKKVIDADDSYRFLMVGNGDMYYRTVEQAANLGIGDKVFFSDFLRGSDVDFAYQLADLFVMPSVSEPFGITPLESIKNGTPVLVSKQSGVSEVINNCLTCDFWDTNKMAKQIIDVCSDKQKITNLKENSQRELQNISWDNTASNLISIYSNLISRWS